MALKESKFPAIVVGGAGWGTDEQYKIELDPNVGINANITGQALVEADTVWLKARSGGVDDYANSSLVLALDVALSTQRSLSFNVAGSLALTVDAEDLIMAGALTVPMYTPGTTDNKLYNVAGSLYFDGSAVFDVTLDASAITGGMSIVGQAISNVAANSPVSPVTDETAIGVVGVNLIGKQMLWANDTWFAFNPQTLLPEFFRWDGGTAWTTISNIGNDPTGRHYNYGVVFDGEIWTGGDYGTGVHSYDPVLDSWTIRGTQTFQQIRGICTYGASVAIIDANDYSDPIKVWDSGTTWTDLGSVGFGKSGSQILEADSELYVLEDVDRKVYQYDTIHTSWTDTLCPIVNPRRMTVWKGVLVVAGGDVVGRGVIYKYVASTWIQLGSPIVVIGDGLMDFRFIAEDLNNTLYGLPEAKFGHSVWVKYSEGTNTWIDVMESTHSEIGYGNSSGEFNPNNEAGFIDITDKTGIVFRDVAEASGNGYLTGADWATFNSKANVNQSMYIGTTAVAINRASSALTLAGLTLTTPDIGTPSAGVLTSCTGLPVAGLANGTDGELITWDASGVAATIAAGTATHVLTSNGPDTVPTFQAAGAGVTLAASATTGGLDLTVQEIGFQAAAVDANGYLTSTDWGTFNAKADIDLGVLAKTSSHTVLSTESSTVFTNEAAVAEVPLTLPTAAAGLGYTFYVQAAQYLKIIAGASDTIRNAASESASAGYIRANTVGNSVTMVAINDTEWVVTSAIGTWTTDA